MLLFQFYTDLLLTWLYKQEFGMISLFFSIFHMIFYIQEMAWQLVEAMNCLVFTFCLLSVQEVERETMPLQPCCFCLRLIAFVSIGNEKPYIASVESHFNCHPKVFFLVKSVFGSLLYQNFNTCSPGWKPKSPMLVMYFEDSMKILLIELLE